MAHTLKAALTEAASRYPQHAAYLHALCHATDPLDDETPDVVEWEGTDDGPPRDYPYG